MAHRATRAYHYMHVLHTMERGEDGGGGRRRGRVEGEGEEGGREGVKEEGEGEEGGRVWEGEGKKEGRGEWGGKERWGGGQREDERRKKSRLTALLNWSLVVRVPYPSIQTVFMSLLGLQWERCWQYVVVCGYC